MAEEECSFAALSMLARTTGSEERAEVVGTVVGVVADAVVDVEEMHTEDAAVALAR